MNVAGIQVKSHVKAQGAQVKAQGAQGVKAQGAK